MSYFVIILAAIIGISDGYPLLKNKQWNVFFVLLSTLCVSVILIILYSIGVPPPIQAVTKYVTKMIKPVLSYN